MKFIAKRDKLLKPLQAISGIVTDKRQTMAILSHVFLSVKGKKLQLIGSDSDAELKIDVTLDSKATEDGVATVAARKFLDICRALPIESSLEFELDDRYLKILSEHGEFVLATLPAEEFPRFEENKDLVEFTIEEKALKDLLIKTAFAIPQQNLRKYLNGLLFAIKEGFAEVLAVDGHRLAKNRAKVSVADDVFAQIVIPRKCIIELMRLLEDTDTQINIGLNSNYIRIDGEDFCLFSKLISGKIPNYNKIIPTRSDKNIIFDSQQLKQALVRVAVLSNELFRSVCFQFRQNLLMLVTDNYERESAFERFEIDYVGEDVDIILNVDYLLDILNCVTSSTVIFSIKNSEQGILIEEGEEQSKCLYVVMPVRRQ